MDVDAIVVLCVHQVRTRTLRCNYLFLIPIRNVDHTQRCCFAAFNTSYNYLSDTPILLSQIDGGVNVNLVLCIHDVKTTTLRCETPEEEDEETAGEDDPTSNEGTSDGRQEEGAGGQGE